MRIACTECSLVIEADDLCPHRSPVCWCCCHEVHPYIPEQHDDPGDAA